MSEFKKTFVSGVLYTSIAKYLGIFLSIIISAILARLLQPEDFGIVAVATVIIGFINLITDFGLGPAIVQNDTLSKKDLKSLFSFTIIVGTLASLLLFAGAGLISDFYDDKDLIPIIRLLSLNVFFASVNIVPNALLLKEKKFKLIAKRTLLMQALGGGIAVLCAFVGLGLYALVIQSILSAAGIFIFNYILQPIPFSLHFTKSSIKKVFSFSFFQFLCSIITYLNGTLDKLLVGKKMGLSDLGYYEKSYRLMRLPVMNLTYVFTPVMQPMFKEFKDDMRIMGEKYCVLFKFLIIIGMPLSSYLYFEASDLICLFYGMNWIPAIRPFQLFSISVGFMILLASTGPIYQASNNVRIMTIACILEAVIGLTCLYIGLSLGGINVVAFCISFGIMLRFVTTFSIIFFRIFHLSIYRIIKESALGLIGTVFSTLLFYFVSLEFGGYISFWRIVLNTVILCSIVLLLLYYSKLFNLKKSLKRK